MGVLRKGGFEVAGGAAPLLDADQRHVGGDGQDVGTLASAVTAGIFLGIIGAGAGETNDIVAAAVEERMLGEARVRHGDPDPVSAPALAVASRRVHGLDDVLEP